LGDGGFAKSSKTLLLSVLLGREEPRGNELGKKGKKLEKRGEFPASKRGPA